MTRNPDSSTIIVACACDRRYTLPLAVMLNSAGTQAAPGVGIHAYCLDDGVPDVDKRRVAASLAGNVHLTWRRSVSALEGLPTWGRMPLTTYQKLVLDEWLPAGLPRVLWLDCDLLILEDLSPLWRCDMGDAAVMAVQDERVPRVSSRFGVGAWRELGLAPDAKYFNAGVLVIDLERSRRREVGSRCLDYLRAYQDRVYFWDQEAMNAVLAGRWGELDRKWNWHPSLNRQTGAREAERGLAQGPPEASPRGILHFSGMLKPWSFAGEGGCRDLYRTYQDRTAWAGWRPPRRWYGALPDWYESSRLRHLLYPTEQLATIALHSLTRRRPGLTLRGADDG
jgi:lipopolysaccharide biosynthesis glycosyltransferase